MDIIHLWEKAPFFGEKEPESSFNPYIKTYFIKNSPACILVCPGGGYEYLSDIHEGSEIAEWLNSKGISAAVLYYRVAPYTQPNQLSDVKRAMRILKYKSEEAGYPKNKIGIMGFSAGGHLAGCASVHYEEEKNPSDNIDKEASRPDFQILCYPVVTTDMSFTHHDSIISLLGKELENEELAEYYSIEKQITADTPPAFIWHTADDNCVPMKNSLVYAQNLTDHRIPTELHIYPFGEHGASLAKNIPNTEKWTEDLEKWLENIILKDND